MVYIRFKYGSNKAQERFNQGSTKVQFSWNKLTDFRQNNTLCNSENQSESQLLFEGSNVRKIRACHNDSRRDTDTLDSLQVIREESFDDESLLALSLNNSYVLQIKNHNKIHIITNLYKFILTKINCALKFCGKSAWLWLSFFI